MTSPAEPPVENSAKTSSARAAASIAVSVPLQELSVVPDSSPVGPAVPGVATSIAISVPLQEPSVAPDSSPTGPAVPESSRQKPPSAGKEKALGVSDQPVEGPAIHNWSQLNTPLVTIGGSCPGSKRASEKRASIPKQKKHNIINLSAV